MAWFRESKERVDNFRVSVIPEIVKSKFERRKQEMTFLQKKTQSVIVSVEKQVRAMLDTQGIPATLRIPYLNYYRTLIKARFRYHCKILEKVARVQKAKFVELGLDPDVLDKIASLVIAVSVEQDAEQGDVLYWVVIDNTANPNDLTDYQILIDLTGNTQYFEDAGENPLSTYFTDLEGNELPFWREEFNSINKIAKFWVKVPFIPANDKAQIKMIVNKSRTVDTSDPYATFLLFDDFDDGVLDPNWTQVGHGYGDSQWIEQNGVLEGRTTDWNSLLYYKGFNENSICIDVDIMIINADELQGVILRYEDSIDEGYSTELYDVSWWYTAFQTREIVQDGGNILAYYSMTFDKNVWYHIRTKTHQDRIIHELYKDDALLAGLDVSGLSEHPSGSVGFLMDCWSAEVHAKWDNLRVRRYIPPEPTITVEKIT